MAKTNPKDWSPSGGPPGSIQAFVRASGVTITALPIPARPDREDIEDPEGQEWNDRAFHWKVTIRKGRKRFVVYYSAGPAAPEEPTAEEVLDNLALDAASIENAPTFLEWAQEFGYNPDSRRAENIHKDVQENTKKLKNLLGDELYRKLLWETERE